MTEEAVLDLLHRGTPLATAIQPAAENTLAWIGVYPLNLEDPDSLALLRNRRIPADVKSPVYNVRKFEVDCTLIEADVWLSEMTSRKIGRRQRSVTTTFA